MNGLRGLMGIEKDEVESKCCYPLQGENAGIQDGGCDA